MTYTGWVERALRFLLGPRYVELRRTRKAMEALAEENIRIGRDRKW